MFRLAEDGFMVVPGPVNGAELDALAHAYDAALEADPAANKIGSTSVRVDEFVNRDPCFDALYIHSPLLDAAANLLGEDFKLSAFHARSVSPFVRAQALHQDFEPIDAGWPMLGFIFMVDEFRADNAATRFVRGSHHLNLLPPDLRDDDFCISAACGPPGSMVLFNGSTWHGHGVNVTGKPRRSIQGSFIRGDQTPAVDHASVIRTGVAARLSSTARCLLRLPD